MRSAVPTAVVPARRSADTFGAGLVWRNLLQVNVEASSEPVPRSRVLCTVTYRWCELPPLGSFPARHQTDD
jgi:hypothetical protein